MVRNNISLKKMNKIFSGRNINAWIESQKKAVKYLAIIFRKPALKSVSILGWN